MTTEKDNIEQTETKVDETTDTSVQSETEESTPDILEQAVQRASSTVYKSKGSRNSGRSQGSNQRIYE